MELWLLTLNLFLGITLLVGQRVQAKANAARHEHVASELLALAAFCDALNHSVQRLGQRKFNMPPKAFHGSRASPSNVNLPNIDIHSIAQMVGIADADVKAARDREIEPAPEPPAPNIFD